MLDTRCSIFHTVRMQGPRAVRLDEFDQVINLVNRVFRADIDQDVTTDYPLVFAAENHDNLRVILEDDRVVTHLATKSWGVNDRNCHFQVGMVNCVVTDPNYRGRGLAKRVTQDALDRMCEAGADFGLLWTDTPPIYQSSGWEVVGTNGWAYLVEPQVARQFQQTHTVRVFDEKIHLQAATEMYHSQPYCLTRSPFDCVTLFTLPKVTTWVAEGEHGVAGYAVVAEACNKNGVVEWRGAMPALESLLAHVLPQWRSGDLQVFVPNRSCDMSELLQHKKCDRRIPMEQASGAGLKMVRICHLRQLLERMLPVLENRIDGDKLSVGIVVTETSERISMTTEGGRIRIGVEHVPHEFSLTLRQTANLLFGPQQPSQWLDLPNDLGRVLDRMFPFDFHVGMLDYV